MRVQRKLRRLLMPSVVLLCLFVAITPKLFAENGTTSTSGFNAEEESFRVMELPDIESEIEETESLKERETESSEIKIVPSSKLLTLNRWYPCFTPSIALYSLSADSKGVISWRAPDGNVYRLDPKDAPTGQWKYTDDMYGNHVMAYMAEPPTTGVGYPYGIKYFEENPSGDGVLVVTLKGAPGISATLLHGGDDIADRRYYYSTDGGNNNPLDIVCENHPAFILRAVGVKGSPVKPYANFRVMVVRESKPKWLPRPLPGPKPWLPIQPLLER